MIPSVEDAEWNPPFRKLKGKTTLQSILALQSLKKGQVKRIIHSDMLCEGKKCLLRNKMSVIRKQRGWKLESYHESQYVAVVRRLK